jgi:O-antigen ligase
MVQAWAFPGIVNVLSINPQTPDLSESWRFQGLTEFPVTLGLSAAMGVLLALGLFVSEERRRVRWGLAIQMVICSFGALLSGSRTFLAALIPGLIVFLLLHKQRRRSVVHAIVTLIVLGGVVTFFAPEAISQYSGRIDEVGLMDYGRLAVAAQAIVDISQNPILGWGVEHFADAGAVWLPEINDVQGVHVTFLQYWYGAGLLGAVGFLALFAIPTWQMVQSLRKKDSNHCTNAVRLILATYLSIFVMFSLGPYLYNRYLYIPMFILAGFVSQVWRPTEALSLPLRHRLSTKPAANLQTSV